MHVCLTHFKGNKSGSASVADVIAYILKFEFVINMYIRIRRSRKRPLPTTAPAPTNQLYQNYLEEEIRDRHESRENGHVTCRNGPIDIEDRSEFNDNCQVTHTNSSLDIDNSKNINNSKARDDYCNYLDEAIFGSPVILKNVTMDNLKVKRNSKGLVAKAIVCDEEKKTSNEIIKHNIEKVQFYEQDVCPTYEDIFVSIFNILTLTL